MKKILCLLGTLLMSISALFAQQLPVIPADEAVRVGKLENGLSYYIRHNAKPEGQAEFYILHNVGAVQEKDDQQGLAHFLEHMAFNGTKNFPDKGIINWLESVGVKFGANLNAGTGQEVTVYNISSVPLLREGIIDSCLLILHDWSYFITLDGAEIDKERGVIVEELRTGNTAQRRVRELMGPAMYNNTIFAHRNVIGNDALLKSFPHQALRDFYHQWYRTDQQVIVVVGDVDVDQIEAKIKSMMADIPAVENPTPKASAAIPGNDEPLIGIATDPELTSTQVNVIIRRDAVPFEMNNTVPVYQMNLLLDVITDMASNRLTEISQQPGAPFLMAMMMTTSFTAGTDAVYGAAVAREGEAAKAFEAIYTEIEKIQRYGFTSSEWERVKADKLRAGQQAYDNRNDRRNAEFVWPYLENFRSNAPMPDAATKWQMDSTLLEMIPLQAINQVAMAVITDANQSITIQSPAKEGVAVPTEAEMRALITKVRDGEVEAYQDNTVKEPLLQSEPVAGKVVKTETDKFGATLWTLSNGAKVLLKQTDFKADELLFSVNTTGGASLLTDATEIASVELLPTLVSMSGVGKFSATELEKQLSGKAVRINVALQDYENGFGGSTSPKDVETALQLLYLYVTAPRFDQADFDRMVDRYRSALANVDANPAYAVQKHVQELLFPNNPRREVISLAKLDKMTFEASQSAYKQLFSDGGSFTYTFVGNIAPEVLLPLVEKYIGSLPAAKTPLKWKDDGLAPAKGALTDRFAFAMQTPKTTAVTIFSGELPYTLASTMEGSMLKQILDIRYTEVIREENGGTYGVGVAFRQNDRPKASYQLFTQFDTNPEMADELMAIIVAEIQKIADNGATPEDLAKVKEFMVKQRQDDLKRNAIWLNYIDSWYINQIDLTSDYEAILNAVTERSIGDLAKKVLGDGNIARVIMDPAPAAQ